MSQRVYSEINLHLVWRVKDNHPVLHDEIETHLYRFIQGRVFQEDGVVSFGTRDLPWVRDYIRNQREHHSAGRTHDRLERIECDKLAGKNNAVR